MELNYFDKSFEYILHDLAQADKHTIISCMEIEGESHLSRNNTGVVPYTRD